MLLYFDHVIAVFVLCLFLKMTWVGLQSLIVAFTGHAHLIVFLQSSP